MKGILMLVAQAFFQSLIGSITGWFEKKNAKENEFRMVALEHQKKSVIEATNVQIAVEKAQVNVKPVTTRAEALKALGLAPVLIFALMLPGCGKISITSSAESNKPVIRTKKKDAKLLDGPEQLTEREQRLIQYIGELRNGIGEYNKWAVQSNVKNGFPAGDSSPEGWEVLMPLPTVQEPVPPSPTGPPPRASSPGAEVVPLPVEAKPDPAANRRPG